MPIDKVYPSCAETVADIPDGSTIMIGGFAHGGLPSYLILALRDQGAKNLTIITNNMGPGTNVPKLGMFPIIADVGDLVLNGQVKKGIASFPVSRSPSNPSLFEKLYLEGKVLVEAVPQGTFCERMRITAAGLGGFYTRVGVGTVIEKDKEKRVFDGLEYIMEPPLRADFALVNAHKADRMGNLVYKGTSRNFNPLMAAAARITIAQVNEIVEIGELDPEEIITPGVYVDRIVLLPRD